MIGVLSKSTDKEIIEEFFQFFKTPWEFYNSLNKYEILLVAGESPPESDASLIIIYAAEKLTSDSYDVKQENIHESHPFAMWNNIQVPIYKKSIAFIGTGNSAALYDNSGNILGYHEVKGKQSILRIGYNIFEEVLFLLSSGQPAKNALIPTIELHVSMLRSWLVSSGIPLVEIPPVPAGHKFIACLTHDVDFVGIRKHKFDHTMWGFLYRATIGSLLEVFKKKKKWKDLFQNWKAAFSLPFVYMGLFRDFWFQFDRYLEIEKNLSSTFFLIPFKNREGKNIAGRSSYRRAAKYDIKDVKDVVKKLISNGYEVGVHGIDAWHDLSAAKEEFIRISEETGLSDIGIRSHWLCFNQNSYSILEEAGYSYDSTFGYNDAVGYRAGTMQAFKPIGLKKLLELPLHIQDTALFNPKHMNLKKEQALYLCKDLIDKTSKYGGILTILWHQRSLGPERQLEDFYIKLLDQLKTQKAWFSTAGQIIKWASNRRSVQFEKAEFNGNSLNIKFRHIKNNINPQIFLRIYSADPKSHYIYNYKDIPLTGETNLKIPL